MHSKFTRVLALVVLTGVANAQQDPANPAASWPSKAIASSSVPTASGVVLTAFTDRNAWAAAVGSPTTLIGFDTFPDGTPVSTNLASLGVAYVAGSSRFESPPGPTRHFITASTSLPFPMFTSGTLPSEPNFISNRLAPGVFATGSMRFDFAASTTAAGAYVADGSPLGSFSIQVLDGGALLGIISVPPRILPDSFVGVISSAPFTSALFVSDATGDSWGLDDLEFAGTLPLVHCGPPPSSQGCRPSISLKGGASVGSRGSLEIRVSGLSSGTVGRLMYSQSTDSTPFSGGTLCLGAPVYRAPLSRSGGDLAAGECESSIAIDLGSHLRSAPSALLATGSRVYVQFAGRDARLLRARTILSEAVELTLEP